MRGLGVIIMGVLLVGFMVGFVLGFFTMAVLVAAKGN